MAFFAVPVIIAVLVGCIVRIRNVRKLRRLNTFLSDVKNTSTGQGSVLGDWMNRRKGFEKLDQYSDGENEPLDDAMNNDSRDHLTDETISIESKQAPVSTMTNSVAFKMGSSL